MLVVEVVEAECSVKFTDNSSTRPNARTHGLSYKLYTLYVIWKTLMRTLLRSEVLHPRRKLMINNNEDIVSLSLEGLSCSEEGQSSSHAILANPLSWKQRIMTTQYVD